MAVFGLQKEFMNEILKQYFGLTNPNVEGNEIYVGLGLTQSGSHSNTEDFTEVFEGRPFGNYHRARAVFGHSVDGVLTNMNDVVFDTASEDWTNPNVKVEMIGLFTTRAYEDADKQLVKPLVVLRLPQFESVLKGETIMMAPGSIRLHLTDI